MRLLTYAYQKDFTMIINGTYTQPNPYEDTYPVSLEDSDDDITG